MGALTSMGQYNRVWGNLQQPDARPFSILLGALGPMMLRIAGELADGTITWMCGRRTIETHIVPRIIAAAEQAQRPKPRVCVGVPVAVTLVAVVAPVNTRQWRVWIAVFSQCGKASNGIFASFFGEYVSDH